MEAVEKFVPVLGRILLALIFILAGYNKIWTIDATVAQMASHGIPLANILVYGVVALELGGGVLLLFGLFTRWIGLALAFYVLVLAFTFHAYWVMPAAEARQQHAAFFEHIAIVGGMLYVVAFGAGAFSLDALLGRESARGGTAVARA
jgi:putative oxidoreductase